MLFTDIFTLISNIAADSDHLIICL